MTAPLSTEAEVALCAGCRHRVAVWPPLCERETPATQCTEARDKSGPCGPDARHFEAKGQA